MSDAPRQNPLLQALMFDPRYRQWVREAGGLARLPEVLGPGVDYDYAAAVRHGVAPELYPVDGRQHWPSVVEVAPRAEPLSLKAAGHPTAWMEGFMQATGVDPHEADAAAWARARAAGALPRFDRPVSVNRLLGVMGDRW